MELNVLAPGLENSLTYLAEDSHQWGQEESRRRGSLTPQAHPDLRTYTMT